MSCNAISGFVSKSGMKSRRSRIGAGSPSPRRHRPPRLAVEQSDLAKYAAHIDQVENSVLAARGLNANLDRSGRDHEQACSRITSGKDQRTALELSCTT